MDLPFEFIEQALKHRHTMTASIMQEAAATSAWNTDIVRRECEICKKSIVKELEVHHIQARRSATNQRLENGTHMNDKRNLIVICQICHDGIHAEKIVIDELKMTSDGPERNVFVEKPVKKGKWTKEEMETITDTLRMYSSLSLKAIRANLHSKHEIDISEGILGKLRKEL
jgi:hypothetical protein